ncbi:S24 family peptidase, partial [Staphylococcus muscae]|uniref:S24 family peptidase n=1 Tax=Staphylococcus muscae TaxID=1294 RepID=UPI000CD38483
DVYKRQVYGYVSAGTGKQLFDKPQFTVKVKGYIPPHDIALQVNGDSMAPMFQNGEIIFVEKTHDIKNGQVGVFIINGESYIKKVRVEDDRLTLISLNIEYKNLHFYQNEDMNLVGKVIL